MADRLDLDAIRRRQRRVVERGGVHAVFGAASLLVEEDVPALCDEVERLRAVAEAARALRDAVTNVQPLSAIAPVFRSLVALDGD